ncbi:lycopene cyclase family protein [Microcella sp.]|uniref:lycopene cyclase family protein n=1 Tax=Microcella sp. TaxID=1913979 RepID=UPI00391B2891
MAIVTPAAASASPRAVDTLVIGAGAAGLALGARLAERGHPGHVLIVDARHDYRDDRTWSFWAPRTHPLRHLVSHEWAAWRYDDGSSPAVHTAPGITYQTIRGIDYYRDARARIDRSSAVSLQLGVTVTGIAPATPADGVAAGRIRVHTSAGVVTTRHVVDTRPTSTRATMFQCFVGAEVEHGGALHAGSGALTPETAGLMTRMRADDAGFAFTYVLPLTPTTALVELTRFSATPLPLDQIGRERDAELTALGLDGSRVLREEAGVLPMGADPAAPLPVPGVVRAGNGGGALRAATGYAFTRIQAWADDCAERMLAGGAPVGHPPEPWVRREMDRIFLQTLRAHPERAPEFFLALAHRVSPERLVRFLTDRATASDLVAIILALPLGAFLAQLPDRTARLERAMLSPGSAPLAARVTEWAA